MPGVFDSQYLKLKPADLKSMKVDVQPLLLADEDVVSVFKSVRDGIVFTTKRVISVDVQGITGSKIRYSSFPYNKIQTFSVETAGTLDIDSELDLYFSGAGHIKFEFVKSANMTELFKMISEKVL